ncbi:DUF6861 domain-containing protein [Rhodanobacter umsongensis]|uniref:DUF6861 domain-containing protein n=1 Tax=Rhodanobacter umsongensis TaxID=633153 RepID=A0ABW0JK92_9GAMM
MGGMLDSWQQLEHWASRHTTGIRGQAKLISARAGSAQQAIRLSEGLAAYWILRDFRELDLQGVVDDIVAVLRQCLIVMLTTTGGGALIGGVAGSIGGAGVGAIPGVVVGAGAGAQVGEWILIAMGLKALAEYVVKDMPDIARDYWAGIRQAWLAATPPPLPQQPVRVDRLAVGHAAEKIARAHVAVFVLLLMGIVAYLAKGRGSMRELADSVRSSKVGPKFAEWMVRNEGKLKAEPRLRAREKIEPSGANGSKTSGSQTGSTKGRSFNKQDSAIKIHPEITAAQQNQTSAGYKPDNWSMTTIPKGSRVYGGLPGQSPYYTTQRAILDSGRNSAKLFRGLQVAPHPVFGYRPEVGIYQVLEEIEIPTGQALANPAFGKGGSQQFFIGDYGNKLRLVGKVQLWN